MAKGKSSYPVMPVKQYWALREQFKKSIPKNVTDTYVASVLNITPKSAQNNVLTPLRTLGIIDEDGKPGTRATKWRDDVEYPKVCEEIKREVYPQELLDAHPEPKSNLEGVKRWFAHKTGAGQNAVGKMARLYSILCEADPSKAKISIEAEKGKARERRKPSVTKKPRTKVQETASKVSGAMEEGRLPSLNINIQIHISSDASEQQIERIFSSMAKHLYRREKLE